MCEFVLKNFGFWIFKELLFFLAAKNDVNKSRPTSPTPQKNFLSRKKKLETAFKESTVNFRNVAGLEDTLMELLYLMIGLQANLFQKLLFLHKRNPQYDNRLFIES